MTSRGWRLGDRQRAEVWKKGRQEWMEQYEEEVGLEGDG
jgi:hypothetical protein